MYVYLHKRSRFIRSIRSDRLFLLLLLCSFSFQPFLHLLLLLLLFLLLPSFSFSSSSASSSSLSSPSIFSLSLFSLAPSVSSSYYSFSSSTFSSFASTFSTFSSRLLLLHLVLLFFMPLPSYVLNPLLLSWGQWRTFRGSVSRFCVCVWDLARMSSSPEKIIWICSKSVGLGHWRRRPNYIIRSAWKKLSASWWPRRIVWPEDVITR